MERTRMCKTVAVALGLMVSTAGAQLTLPYYGTYSGSAENYAFRISNTNAGTGVTYGGFFFAKSGQGRAVFGQADGDSGIGVKGWAADSGNVLNYGGHFCATGQQGIGVYGWADNTGNVVNYGGKFLAQGVQGVGVHAKGGANGFAGIFEGDIKIVGAGKGIIFPDGSRQTTAGGGTSTPSTGGGWIISGNNMYSAVSGNVGIGTTNPQALLQLGDHTGSDLKIGATYPLEITHAEGGTGAGDVFIKTSSTSKGGRIVLQTRNDTLFDGSQLVLNPDGNVGIGTLFPDWKLLVQGSSKAIAGSAWAKDGVGVHGYVNYSGKEGDTSDRPDNCAGSFVAEGKSWAVGGSFGRGGWNTSHGVGIYARGGRYAASLDGNVRVGGITTLESTTYIKGHLYIQDKDTGNTLVALGEGLDYAEGFDVTDTEDVGPGAVLVIDPENAGKLMLSTSAYDTKVAGIVAGAKDLGSGVRLGTGQFDKDVALAGRVYCNVDATSAAVKPGDLLTTSATPGYAMKVVDHVRAQGAILGKAMESLEQGKKGQILVLVSLQ